MYYGKLLDKYEYIFLMFGETLETCHGTLRERH